MGKTGEAKTGETRTGDTATRDPDWLLDSTPLPTVESHSATYKTVSLSVRASESLRDGTLAPLRTGLGKHDVVDLSDGGFSVIDRADADSSHDLRPPADLDPPRTAGSYYVADYSDTFADQAGAVYSVDVTFQRDRNRLADALAQTTTGRTGEHKTGERKTGDGYRSSNEWAFQMGAQVVRTKRVTVDVVQDTGGESDIDAVELTLVLTAAEAESLERAATHLAGTSVQEVPDGPNAVLDTSAGDKNTVDVTTPDSSSPIPEGSYAVSDWSDDWIDQDAYRLSWRLLKL